MCWMRAGDPGGRAAGGAAAVLSPEDSRNRDTGGTGLGLAIAAQLVSQMDGALRSPTARRAASTPAFALPRRDCILLYLRERRITKPTILPFPDTFALHGLAVMSWLPLSAATA